MDFDDIGDFDDPFIDIGSFLELNVKQDAPFEPVARATSSYVPSPTDPPPLVSFAPSNSPQFLPQGRQVYQPRQQQNQYQPRQQNNNNNQYQPRQQNNSQYQPRQPQNQYQPRQQNQYNPRQANTGQFRARPQNQIRQALPAGRFAGRNQASLQNGSGASPIPNGNRMAAARHPAGPRPPRTPRYQCLAVNNTSIVDIGTILRADHTPGGGGQRGLTTTAAADLGDDFLDIGKFLAVDIRPGPGGGGNGSPPVRRMVGGASLTQISPPAASSTPYGRQAQARRSPAAPINPRQDLRTNPFARASTPAAGQSQARPAFRAQSPAAIRAQRAVSNRQQAAAINRAQPTVINRAQLNRPQAPLNNRARAPFNNRAQAPFNNRAPAPFNNRAPAPFNNRAQVPFNNRAQAPFNNRAQMTVNSRARMPLNSPAQAAAANRFPAANRSQPPASNMATITSQLPPGVTLFKLEKKEPAAVPQPVVSAQRRHNAGGAGNKRKRTQSVTCEVCQMRLSQRHYLARHMLTHSKEDPDAPSALRRSSRVVALATVKQEPASDDDDDGAEAPPPKRQRQAAVAGPSVARVDAGGPAPLIVPYITRLDPRSLPPAAAAAARVDYKSRYGHLTHNGRPLPARMLDVTVRVERINVRRELSLLRRRRGASGRRTGAAAGGGGGGFRSVPPGAEEVITLSDSDDEEEAYVDVGAFLQVDMAGQGPSSRQYTLHPVAGRGERPAGGPGERPAAAAGAHSCPVCGRTFTRRDNCRKHVERVHKIRNVSLIALPRAAAPTEAPPLPLLPPPPPPPLPPANQDILGDLSKLDESMTHLFRIAQDLDSDITMAHMLSGGAGIEGEEVDPVDVCNFLHLSMDSPDGEADEGDPTDGEAADEGNPTNEEADEGNPTNEEADGGSPTNEEADEGSPTNGGADEAAENGVDRGSEIVDDSAEASAMEASGSAEMGNAGVEGSEVAFLTVTIGSDSSANVSSDVDAVDPLAGDSSDVITGDVVSRDVVSRDGVPDVAGDVVSDAAAEIITGDIVSAVAAADPTGKHLTRVDRACLDVAPVGIFTATAVSLIDGSPERINCDPKTTSGNPAATNSDPKTTSGTLETTNYHPVETCASRAAATVELSDDVECGARSSTKELATDSPRDPFTSVGGASSPDSAADPSVDFGAPSSVDSSVRLSVDSSAPSSVDFSVPSSVDFGAPSLLDSGVDPLADASGTSSVDIDDLFGSEPGSLLGLRNTTSTLIVGTPAAGVTMNDGVHASGRNLVDVLGGDADESPANRKTVKVKSLVNSLVPYDSDMSDSCSESDGGDVSCDAGRKTSVFVGESFSEKFSRGEGFGESPMGGLASGELPTVGLQIGGSPTGESSVGESPAGELSSGESPIGGSSNRASPIGGLSNGESPIGEYPRDGGQDYLSTADDPMEISVEAYKATSDDLEDCLVAYQLTRHFN